MTFSYNPGGGPDEYPNSREAPPSELTLAYEEIRGLRTEVARLREAITEAAQYARTSYDEVAMIDGRQASRLMETVSMLRVALKGSSSPVPSASTCGELERAVADYGWVYDGRVTFTLNCVSVEEAKRVNALFDSLRGVPSAPQTQEETCR